MYSFPHSNKWSGNETCTLTVAGGQLSVLVMCCYQWIVLREREGDGANGQGCRESVGGEGQVNDKEVGNLKNFMLTNSTHVCACTACTCMCTCMQMHYASCV